MALSRTAFFALFVSLLVSLLLGSAQGRMLRGQSNQVANTDFSVSMDQVLAIETERRMLVEGGVESTTYTYSPSPVHVVSYAPAPGPSAHVAPGPKAQ